MRNSPFLWILVSLMILVDLYFFQAFKFLTQHGGVRTRLIAHTIYWSVSIGAIALIIILPFFHFDKHDRGVRTTIMAVISGLFFAKLVACFFFLIDDIRRGIQWIAERISRKDRVDDTDPASDRLTRSAFLSWTGIAFSSSLPKADSPQREQK